MPQTVCMCLCLSVSVWVYLFMSSFSTFALLFLCCAGQTRGRLLFARPFAVLKCENLQVVAEQEGWKAEREGGGGEWKQYSSENAIEIASK